MTINVLNQNPTSAAGSVNLMVNEVFDFASSNFAFSSNASASFAGIKITELNTVGTLLYNNSAISINQELADVSKLKFTPVTGASGTPYTSFNFKVKDNAGRYSDYSYKMTINVLSNIEAGVSWFPEAPTQNDVITVFIKNDNTLIANGGSLHWGVNGWISPNDVYRPAGTVASADVAGTPLAVDASDASLYSVTFGPFNNSIQSVTVVDFVIHYANNTWNNNGGADWHIPISTVSGVDEQIINPISVYPNPFSDFTIININDNQNSEFQVNLIDLAGKIIKTETFESNSKYVLYRNQLQAGMYFLQFTNLKNGEIFSEKIKIY